MSIKITISSDQLKAKANEQNLARAEYALMVQVHADMNLYVPKKEGHLRDESFTKGSSIFYPLPYAKAQFYGGYTSASGKKVTFSTYTTPGTGKRWDLKAKANHLSTWQQAFTKGGDF